MRKKAREEKRRKEKESRKSRREGEERRRKSRREGEGERVLLNTDSELFPAMSAPRLAATFLEDKKK